MFLQSGFLLAVTASNAIRLRTHKVFLTVITDPQMTESLLQDLLKTVSALQNDVSELKNSKTDNTSTKGENPRKRPRDSKPCGSQSIPCDIGWHLDTIRCHPYVIIIPDADGGCLTAPIINEKERYPPPP